MSLGHQLGQHRAEGDAPSRVTHHAGPQFAAGWAHTCRRHLANDAGEGGAVLSDPLGSQWLVCGGGGGGGGGGAGRLGQALIEPGVAHGLHRGHACGRVPVQTLLEEVDEGWVITALERRYPLATSRWAAHLPPSGAAAVEHHGAVG